MISQPQKDTQNRINFYILNSYIEGLKQEIELFQTAHPGESILEILHNAVILLCIRKQEFDALCYIVEFLTKQDIDELDLNEKDIQVMVAVIKIIYSHNCKQFVRFFSILPFDLSSILTIDFNFDKENSSIFTKNRWLFDIVFHKDFDFSHQHQLKIQVDMWKNYIKQTYQPVISRLVCFDICHLVLEEYLCM